MHENNDRLLIEAWWVTLKSPGSLLHSADPQSRPVGIIVFAHVIRPSVRHHFSKSSNKSQAKTMFASGETVGLAEWIIDDTCLVFIAFQYFT